MSIDNVSALQNVYSTQNIQNTNNVQQSQMPKVDLNDPVDKVDFSTKASTKKASVGKKIGVGIASGIIPGLGQIINGDVKKGAGFVVGNIALMAATFSNPIFALPAAVLEIASIVDAVKNAK